MEIINLFLQMAAQYGIVSAVVIFGSIIGVALAIMCLFNFLMRMARDYYSRWRHGIYNLQKHECFIKMDHIVKYRLEHVNVPCRLRKKIYQDIMRERVSRLRDSLYEFVSRKEIKFMTSTELFLGVEGVYIEANKASTARLLDDGVPEFILDAMNNRIDENWEYQKRNIKGYCYNTWLYHDNTARMFAVLDNIVVLVEVSMNNLESTLAGFNGNIKDLDYHGIVCGHCQVCVHDAYEQQQHDAAAVQ